MKRDRVLVVDDSTQNRLVASGHLEAAGFEIVEATTGEQALELLGRERIDLVVLDILMPGIGGLETCRRIRKNPAIAEIPVLFLTALGDREATSPALEAGADDLLGKPFHRPELLLRVNALIRQRRTTEQLRQAMRALSEQNEQLRRAEHDKRRMSELIVHDLKSPVAAIIGNAEGLRELGAGDESRDIAGDIIVSAQQIERTARDLLDLSRAEESELKPHAEPFDFGALVNEIATSLRGLARWTNVGIECQVQVPSAVADRELTRRLLQNLVHNAIKHAPPSTTVTIAARLDRGALHLRVLDDGPGVPAEAAEKIFERFVALDEESARRGSHGLGLAFCRLAAEAHGGRIWVEPRDPRGAAFCVELPQP